MEEFKKIIVTPGPHKWVTYTNPTPLPLIGQGADGAVFKLSGHRCVKIFAKPKRARREYKALKTVKGSPYFPQVFKKGKNYIIMEYIQGVPLNNYLLSQGVLSKDLAREILFMLKEMKRLNFKRRDTRIDHILVTSEEKIKVVDHVNALTIKQKTPRRLLIGLKQIGFLETFLEHIEKLDPEVFKIWKSIINN